MKKLINSAGSLVSDALRGMAAAHPSLRVDLENAVVFRAEGPRPGKVGLVSGGGSGHEPLHAGFVGHGMLDAACPGEVFTSPVPDQLVEATKGVDGGAGVLHVVKNYTGDVLNFEMAAELSGDEGVEVATVLVNDDVAVRDSLYTAGRRGTGATLFVEKIAGALAETGAPLAEVARVAREVNERSRSFGVALTPCTVPAAGRPTFELGETEIELGIGIHGEPGRSRAALGEAREIARIAVDAIGDDLPPSGETGQRHGRDAAHRAVRRLRRGGGVPPGEGRDGRAQPGRQLRDQPRHAGLHGDDLRADRRAHPPLGRAGGDARAALGPLTETRPGTCAPEPSRNPPSAQPRDPL